MRLHTTNPTHDALLLTALAQLTPPNHLCSIYESPEEHVAVAMPFIRIGLERGEQCIYIADDEWVLRGAPRLERWIEYESRLTHVLARHSTPRQRSFESFRNH
jgi:hypothetical protein